MSDPLLRVRDLSLSRRGVTVVRNVSFDLAAGDRLFIVGHNGSGKTTLLQGLAGLLPIDAGSVSWARHAKPLAGGLLLQEVSVFGDLRVRENITAGVLRKFRPAESEARPVLAAITEVVPELSSRLTARADRLSGGQRRLTALVRATLANTGVFLFDEPTLGIARPLVDRLFSVLQRRVEERGGGAIIVEHDVAMAARYATRICVLRRGDIVYDGSPEILEDVTALRRLYL